MGKLSESDFADLTARYRKKALAAIDAQRRSDPSRAVEGRSEGSGPRRLAYCPACGGRLAAKANFCGQCGRALGDLAT